MYKHTHTHTHTVLRCYMLWFPAILNFDMVPLLSALTIPHQL